MPKILQLRAKIVHWKKTLEVDPSKLDIHKNVPLRL